MDRLSVIREIAEGIRQATWALENYSDATTERNAEQDLDMAIAALEYARRLAGFAPVVIDRDADTLPPPARTIPAPPIEEKESA